MKVACGEFSGNTSGGINWQLSRKTFEAEPRWALLLPKRGSCLNHKHQIEKEEDLSCLLSRGERETHL